MLAVTITIGNKQWTGLSGGRARYLVRWLLAEPTKGWQQTRNRNDPLPFEPPADCQAMVVVSDGLRASRGFYWLPLGDKLRCFRGERVLQRGFQPTTLLGYYRQEPLP